MFRSHFFYRPLAACGLVILTSSAAQASVSTADSVLQYTPGAAVPSSYWGEPYSDFYNSAPLGLPDASINLPEDDAEGVFADDSIVTPFNAEYNPSNVAAIGGDGGYIALHLSQPVATDGFTLGVHTGSGLNDSSYPSGLNLDPAATYTDMRSATVLVSQDGTNWVSLGLIEFDNPTNIYTDIFTASAGNPYGDTPGNQLANFGQPFLGNVSTFNGLDFADTISALNGSGGGNWLDLSGTGLSAVNDIAFETQGDQTMFIDSIVGIPVPEPTYLCILMVPLLLRRHR